MHMLVCSGSITQVSNDLICSTGWTTQLAVLPFDPSQIDPLTATYLFTVGFFIPAVPICAVLGIRAILSLIKNG